MSSSSLLYIVVILISSTADTPDYQPLYEESFILIEADSEEQARDKILQEYSQPTAYLNQYGEKITWTLQHIIDVASLDAADLASGKTLYSRHFRNYDAYRSFEPLLSGEPL